MWLLWTIVALSAILLAIAYRVRWLQYSLLYHPQMPNQGRAEVPSPSAFAITNYETLAIKTRDGAVLSGFITYPQNDLSYQVLNDGAGGGGKATRSSIATKDCVLVYFHGNAGNVGQRLPIAALLMRALSCPVVMMDYRSYGNSSGESRPPSPPPGRNNAAALTINEEEESMNTFKHDFRPSERGLKTDAHATIQYVIDHILPKHHPSCTSTRRVIVMGTSLGGAVSIYLGSHRKYEKYIAAIILENTFTSICDMLDSIGTPFLLAYLSAVHPLVRSSVFNFYRYALRPLILIIGWNSIRLIPHVAAPTLFLSGLRDELVPPWQMEALHAAATSSQFRRMSTFATGKHNDMPGQQGYSGVITSFLNEALHRFTSWDKTTDVV